MNIHISFGGLLFGIVILLVIHRLYRLYRRVGGRCRGKKKVKILCGDLWEEKPCGNLWVERVHQMELGEGETVPLKNTEGKVIGKTVILWNSDGQFRWWLRRTETVTVVICNKCNHKELVHSSNRPISFWHAKYVEICHPMQYRKDSRLGIVIWSGERDRQTGNHLKKLTPDSVRCDVPPLDWWELVKIFFDLRKPFL